MIPLKEPSALGAVPHCAPGADSSSAGVCRDVFESETPVVHANLMTGEEQT